MIGEYCKSLQLLFILHLSFVYCPKCTEFCAILLPVAFGDVLVVLLNLRRFNSQKVSKYYRVIL
jgi:hypothetical protein